MPVKLIQTCWRQYAKLLLLLATLVSDSRQYAVYQHTLDIVASLQCNNQDLELGMLVWVG